MFDADDLNSLTPAPYSLDYQCESPAGVTHPAPSVLYVRSTSTRRSLRDCERGHPCNLADCPRCGERVARNAQLDMLAKFADFPSCVSLRLSVARNADLDQGYRNLAAARRRFLEIARLRHTTMGSLRQAEITWVRAEKNWHDHLLVFPIGDPSNEEDRLIDAWRQACRETDQEPSWDNQISATVPALEYVLKSRLGVGEGSLRRLISRAAHGDLDAVDDWQEWDAWRHAHPRARFRASWLRPEAPAPAASAPAPRDQHLTAATDAELAQLAILAALGVRSRAEQVAALGIGDSTAARRRRHFAPGALGAPDRIAFRVS